MYKDYDFHNPTVKVEYDEKRNYWYLLRGPETFYDENNKLKTWSTKEESLKWVQTNHPEYRIIE